MGTRAEAKSLIAEPGLMKEAWDEWNAIHTWENRTLFEMFAAGFFKGWEKANARSGE